MIQYPQIDPVLFRLGPLQVHWYGLMYVLGFIASYLLVKFQLKTVNFKELKEHFENLNIVLVISLIIGGRLGYVFFYNFSYYLQHPLEIPATWSGGMSFHGAALGVIVGGLIFCQWKRLDFWKTADIYVVTIPIGLGLGRIGNFINGELIGRPTDLPWGMIFPGDGFSIARHPSQLYEALLEGLVLFVLLWLVRRKPWEGKSPWPHGSLLALFLIVYGVFRFIIEFVREPDHQIGILFELFTMGQVLSSMMVISGVLIWFWRARKSIS